MRRRLHPVDLRAVRRARVHLDAIVEEYPQLVGVGGDGVHGWMKKIARG